jgi:hypothetical protein
MSGFLEADNERALNVQHDRRHKQATGFERSFTTHKITQFLNPEVSLQIGLSCQHG